MAGTIEQIKSRLSIVDVAGSYLKLERAGSNLKARCPFHNEKTPSFFVSPERDTFHCFGCNKGGDIITFVQEIEGIEFPDALRILADRAGVEISREDNSSKSEKGRLLAVMAAATDFYQKELEKNAPAKKYLAERGLTDETIRSFKIGFALDSWRSLYTYLQGKGFSPDEMERAGLVIKTDRGYYDRFRSRIMFPISNISGVVVAFTGRIFRLSDSSKLATAKTDEAKYVNSPQTLLYDKSRILYGFDRARVAIREAGACILVEGQVDLIMAHQAGTKNAVAVSGTALTENHLEAIRRLANKLVLSFDGDSAGLKATGRGLDLALNTGLDVRLIKLPGEKDPADLILKDPQLWLETVGNSKHIIDFYIDTIREKESDPRKIVLEIGKNVLPYVKSLPSKMEQALFVGKISRLTNLPEASIWDDLSRTKNINNEIKNVSEDKKRNEVNIPRRRSEVIFEKIAGIVFWQERFKEPQISFEEVVQKLETILGKDKVKIMMTNAKLDNDRLIFEAELAQDGNQKLRETIDSLIALLYEEVLQDRLGEASLNLKDAEKSKKEEEIEKYLKLCQTISEELTKIKHKK